MPHPLITQLRYARSEFKRGLLGLSDPDARRRHLPMNCISWNIGHMAWQEQRYWLTRLQGQTPLPHLNELVGNGQPACTPPLAEMWEAWQTITNLTNPFLDTLTIPKLQEIHYLDDQQTTFTPGSLLQRVIYHYWYHTGENAAIRQVLGHTNLPEFVGNIDDKAPYRPETTT
ncbi:MAG: DinB family protein [Ktedonobacteraceae bacterium]|nr:DinB family protein [Ktedonobacteraceae bacterium]